MNLTFLDYQAVVAVRRNIGYKGAGIGAGGNGKQSQNQQFFHYSLHCS